MVLQNSSDRQLMVTIFKKMTLRIKAAIHNGICQKYETFIQNLFGFFMQCFYADASFSRRSIALECLQDCILHFDEFINNQKTAENAQILQNCFHDSFEHNKFLALQILKTFPIEATKLNEDSVFRNLLEFTINLTRSVKPPDSISAGYFIKYLLISPIVDNNELLEKLLR